MLDLVRPCAKCPFRTDVPFYLGAARRKEIADALSWGETFHCHETVHYDEQHWDYGAEDGLGHYTASGDEQHCAGALIVLHKIKRPNQVMQIAQRLALWEPEKLDMDSPVFNDLEEFIREGA